MTTQQEDLSIAVLVYFVLALPVAIVVCTKHGFGRHAGWLYLLILTVFRILGSSLEIAAIETNSAGTYIAAAVFTSIGLVPLVLTLNGIVKRIHDGLEHGHLPPRLFQFIHIITLVALILGIVAGSTSYTTDPGTLSTIAKERKAASILLIISAVINSVLALLFVVQIRRVFHTDRKLAILAAISTPFILVRVIYAVLLAFSTDPRFNSRNPNIYVQSFMQSLMEFILFAIYATGGLLSDKTQAGDHEVGRGSQFIKGTNREGFRAGSNNSRPVAQSTAEARY